MRWLHLVLLPALTGCSAVSSTVETSVHHVHPYQTAHTDRPRVTTGMSYYLPKNNLVVVYKREPATPAAIAEAQASLAKAQKVRGETASLFDKKKSEFTAQKRLTDSVKALGSALQDAPLLIKKAELSLAEADAAEADAQTKAAEQRLKELSSAPRGSTIERIEIKIEPTSGDPRYRITINPHDLPTHDRRFSIIVDRTGLLQFVGTKTLDRTPETIANLSRAALAVAFGAPVTGPPVGTSPELLKEQDEEFFIGEFKPGRGESRSVDSGRLDRDDLDDEDRVKDLRAICGDYNRVRDLAARARQQQTITREWVIYPDHERELAYLNCRLAILGSALRVEIFPGQTSLRSQRYRAPRGETRFSTPGVVYRLPIEWRIRIYRLYAGRTATRDDLTRRRVGAVREVAIMLPNGGALRVLPFQWASCTFAGYEVQFVDGVPVRQEIGRRSEIAACARIPLDIITEILSVPAEALGFKTTTTQKQVEFIDAQTKLIEAQKRLQSAQ